MGVVVRLLGGFALAVDGAAVPVLPGAQRLVALVALADGPLRRSRAAALLWPAASPARAASCLRSTLYRVARACRDVLSAEGDRLAVNPAVQVDVHLVRTVAVGATPAPLPLGELLPGWEDRWVQEERDRLHHTRLRALERLSAAYRDRGEHLLALQAADAAVRTDPLRESAHRELIRVHLAGGNHADAMRQYRYCSSLLRAELGVRPSPDTTALVRALVAEQPVPRGREVIG
ncbi:AfsR/SARP family transcriptional regulator [Actinokineospora bangkokensis]|uniref:Bacterial transcriptional activator domain-containing protein n=1 Tax=Actinokineospora bangkokensis TaxID=1193682 RepID=A0A1Q9LMU9_9PSEU|nr:BTAD domain-containing putative transcriptional regulator [Actinokineospora bangkokensis]OLR93314.1 hypothetical protein BJP25_17720 [Actinokineospora bangkokensis]